MFKQLLLALLLGGAQAWTGMDAATGMSRRHLFGKVASGVIVAGPASAFAADLMCPAKANNCVAGTWTPPAGSKDALAQLKAVLDTYPQAGQADVDGGGWKYAVDEPNSLRLEFSSSGKRNFAKIFNGGKPFVDDLTIAPSGAGFAYKSQSRKGDSDFGVNAKRIAFINAALTAKGWGV